MEPLDHRCAVIWLAQTVKNRCWLLDEDYSEHGMADC